MITAPGKIILFGEHAVVYNILGMAAAVDLHTSVNVANHDKVVKVTDPWREIELTEQELTETVIQIRALMEKNDYASIKSLYEANKFLGLQYVLGLVQKKIGFHPLKMEISTELRKGMGTSASMYAGAAKAIADFMKRELSLEEISRFAYEGDVVAHGGTPSGIDNNVVTYGRYICFRKTEGLKHVKTEKELPVVIGDTQKPAQTGKMVSMLRELKEKDEKVQKALDSVEQISQNALKELEKGNLEDLGKLINQNQEKLDIMQVSTPKLDKLIKASLDAGAYGAKLSGGGGGGIMFALCSEENKNKVAHAIEKAGGSPLITKIGAEGIHSTV